MSTMAYYARHRESSIRTLAEAWNESYAETARTVRDWSDYDVYWESFNTWMRQG